MKYTLFLLIFVSCSTDHRKQASEEFNPWSIFNAVDAKELVDNDILEMLGKPDKERTEDGYLQWIYFDKATKRQSWAVGFSNKDKRVLGLAYIPVSSGTSWFVTDVEKIWKRFNCKRIEEDKLIAGHHYTKDRILKCADGKKLAEYNRYDQIIKISVEK